ncbi:IclR family transcriptional regulator [Bradyrhizobium sp. 14AA]
MSTSEHDVEESRNRVQSVDIAMSILAAIATASRRVSLTEIARQLGYAPSKVHRYFTSFVRAGILVQQSENGLYEFGPLALKIGLSAIGQIDAVRFASEGLAVLRETTGLSILLVVWGDMGPTVVRLEENIDAVRTNIRLGSVLPVLTTAIGRVFLSYLPATSTAAFVARECKESEVAAAIDKDALIAQIRRDRFCQIKSYMLPNVIAMAAPILNADGYAAAVVAALTRPLSNLTATHDAPARALSDFCHDVSTRIGGS